MIANPESIRRRFPRMTAHDKRGARQDERLDELERKIRQMKKKVEEVLDKSE